jgi:predicted  nucleic acid-binding Zn-ribbon protein
VGGTVLAELTQLLELQTIDGQLHERSARIDRLGIQRKGIEERIASAEADVVRLREQLAQLEHDSRMRNLEVDELDANIRQYQERLDTGIISFKEMEDLRTKIESERGRISTMEDEALVLMDTIEETRAGVARAADACAAKVEEHRSQIGDIASEIDAIRAEIEELEQQRATLCEAIPAYLIKQYDTLRARSGEPIAVVRNGTCSGCKLKLAGSTVERARGSLGIVTCEHCSRILYVEDFAHDN